MDYSINQISALEKVRITDKPVHDEIFQKSVLAGERFCYQICIHAERIAFFTAAVESPLADYVKLYRVRDAVMDAPVTMDVPMEDYITQEPGLMPDILVPLEETGNQVVAIKDQNSVIWVKIDIPRDMPPGTYPLRINFTVKRHFNEFVSNEYKDMELTVIPAVMPEQKLIYTRWIYADCIATAHHVDIYSDKHWDLIDKYIAAAANVGINMILVPTHTPPLDTEVGTTRPCVQLVDIEKKGDNFIFSFAKFKRYIDICKKYHIKYFEIAHMFSQWGAKYAANIMVTEDDKTDYMFGWHVAADSEEYRAFLKQYVKAISEELEREGISETTYFHISDEPYINNLDSYKAASEIIRPLIGNSKTFDALSVYEIYKKGLIECPVTAIAHIHEFLEHEIENQWTYYCGTPQTIFTNSIMAMPSCRTRILGFLLYKYNIKGFLHWGFNFYNSCVSLYPINPYVTTSCDRSYPSGDGFIVYPAPDGVYPSIRGEVIYDAIQDMNVCFALEQLIGRKQVIKMIDEAAGRDLRFDDYPSDKNFLEKLRADMTEAVARKS